MIPNLDQFKLIDFDHLGLFTHLEPEVLSNYLTLSKAAKPFVPFAYKLIEIS